MYLEVSVLNFRVPLDGKMATKAVEIIEMGIFISYFTWLILTSGVCKEDLSS